VTEKRTWYLKVKPSECAEHVILVCDPARQSMFASQMQDIREVASEREFRTLSGAYKGSPVSVISVGIGAPSAVLVLEELWELGVKVVLRAGTGMSLGVPLGDFILAQAATRNEGTSASYLPMPFPAVPDVDLFLHFHDVLQAEKAPLSSGVILTSDGFYTDMFRHAIEGKQPRRPEKTLIQDYDQFGIVSADMETSALYIAGQYLGIKCLTILVATVDGYEQRMLEAELRKTKELELARLALEGIHQYASRSNERK